jgi:hypothetical protein
MNRFMTQQEIKKLLKTIESPNSIEVSNNLYGLTAIISNRPVGLSAVAKDFTSTYFIGKKQFLECVAVEYLDF